MSFYIGGDTQEFEFDFFTKIANSVVDCPMKIYRAEVDPDNLPSPTDPLWKEITSQSVIDKLKEQNEMPISNLATDRSTIQWGDKTLTKTNVIKIVDDFKGKISGSVVENPNVWKYGDARASTELLSPSNENFIEQAGYNQITTLNNDYDSSTVNVNGQIPQHLFSFNIIEIVERKFGTIPKETVAEKVEWLKDNLYSIRCDWYGYGSCPSGNKAMLMCWYANMSLWNTTTKQTHNASTPTLLCSTRRFAEDQQGYHMIDINGFIHFLAYTDPSDGITPSTIYTDYVSIELTLKIPEATSEFYDFYTDSNNRRDAGLTNIVLVKKSIGDMTSDFNGKVAGSVVENPNIMKGNKSTSLISPNVFTNEGTDTTYNTLKNLDGSCSTMGYTNVSGEIPQQLFSFNLIEIVERKYGSIPKETVAEKVEWLKDNLYSIRCDWYGYGSCPSGNKAMLMCWYANMSLWNTTTKQTHNASTSTLLCSTRRFAEDQQGYHMIDINGFIHFLAYTDPSDGVTPSAIYTDYIKLTLTFKNDTKGYEYFTNESAEISVTTNNKASAFLIECDLTPICNALYGGSNSVLKSALKSIETNVWAMGSGANGNELGYGVEFTNWHGTPSIYNMYPAKHNISAISKLGKLFPTQGDCAWVITSENKFYIVVYSTNKSNGSIPSEVNLDYVNIKVKLTRTPDNIPPIPIELGTKWSILIKGFSPSWGNTKPMVSENRYLSAVKEDNSDVFTLYKENVYRNTKIWWKKLSDSKILKQDDNREVFQTSNILICYENNKLSFYELFNNSILTKNALENVVITSGKYNLYLGKSSISESYIYAFLDSVHFFNNKTFTDEEAEILLRGRNTIDTSNEHYNELAESFKNPLIKDYILPNNRYTITGQAKLYSNGYYTRTVQDCEFITTEKENKIELIGTAEVTRLD